MGEIPQPTRLRSTWPNGIATTAYATAQQRRDSVHQRIDVLLSFVTTVTVAGPVVAAAVLENPTFDSPLLIGAGAMFAIVVATGLVARVLGSLQQVSPKELYTAGCITKTQSSKRGSSFGQVSITTGHES